MKNGWEPGGPLIDVLVELSLVKRLGPRPGDDAVSGSRKAMEALRHAHEAYRLLDAARLKAIKEECMSQFEDQWCGDSPDEESEVERFPESMRLIEEAIVQAVTEQFISSARLQADGVANPVTREQLRECLDVAERVLR